MQENAADFAPRQDLQQSLYATLNKRPSRNSEYKTWKTFRIVVVFTSKAQLSNMNYGAKILLLAAGAAHARIQRLTAADAPHS